jgi:hypothetical protein
MPTLLLDCWKILLIPRKIISELPLGSKMTPPHALSALGFPFEAPSKKRIYYLFLDFHN